MRWLALAFVAGAVEAFHAHYEQVNHWSGLGLAMLGILTSILWIPLLIYGAFVSWRKPDCRRKQARRLIYFVVALLALHALLMTTQTVSAIRAGRVVKAAEQFNAIHGHCPTSLKELGMKEDFDHGQSRGYKGIAYYNGAVFYPGILPFSMNEYQCPGGPWTYSTD
jgi:hypothetical protein